MKCFLSYRLADAESVARELFLHFQGRFGEGSVFWDQESIPPESDWRHVLRREVEAADVVVALVGPSWLRILHERSKSSSPDYVRFELEYAHQCNKPVQLLDVSGRHGSGALRVVIGHDDRDDSTFAIFRDVCMFRQALTSILYF